MPRPKAGYHDLALQIPDGLWGALAEEAQRERRSITGQLTRILQDRYPHAPLPVETSKRGRPPKQQAATPGTPPAADLEAEAMMRHKAAEAPAAKGKGRK